MNDKELFKKNIRK